MPFRMSFVLLLRRLFLPYFMLFPISEWAVYSSFKSSFSRKLLATDLFSEQHASWFNGKLWQGCIWGGEIHPGLAKSSGRDDSQREISSWFDGNLLQGWFPAGNFILIWWKTLAEMIPRRKFHPGLMKMSGRDDSQKEISSWFNENVWQGWFPARKCIPQSQNSKFKMHEGPKYHPEKSKAQIQDTSTRYTVKPRPSNRSKKQQQQQEAATAAKTNRSKNQP